MLRSLGKPANPKHSIPGEKVQVSATLVTFFRTRRISAAVSVFHQGCFFDITRTCRDFMGAGGRSKFAGLGRFFRFYEVYSSSFDLQIKQKLKIYWQVIFKGSREPHWKRNLNNKAKVNRVQCGVYWSISVRSTSLLPGRIRKQDRTFCGKGEKFSVLRSEIIWNFEQTQLNYKNLSNSSLINKTLETYSALSIRGCTSSDRYVMMHGDSCWCGLVLFFRWRGESG